MKDKPNTFTIGIDLGGTNLKCGVVDDNGDVVADRFLSLPPDKSPDVVLKLIAQQVKWLRARVNGSVLSIGFGVPGLVNFQKGIVYRSPNLPKWRNVPIKRMLEKMCKLPVAMDNDANFYAIGEQKFGAGRGHKNMVLLTLGTGIGGGIILNGEVFHGDEGFAGEVGHIVVEPDGRRCGCGSRGCFEQYAASHAFGGADPSEIARAALEGKKGAMKIWTQFGKYLGIGIATLLNTLGVETFVIGGGITRAWRLFYGTAKRTALSHTYPYHRDKLIIKRALLGDRAGIMGSAAIARTIIR